MKETEANCKDRSNRNSYTLVDFFDSYKKYTEDNPAYKISEKKFRSILKDYFSFLSSEIIDKGREVKLPARIGTVYVRKSMPARFDRKCLSVDFNETRRLNKTILHLNEHSNGYNFKFHWSKRDVIVEHKSFYELVMSRANKRHLAYVIKNKLQDFIEN